jgi:hypothetical protein
MAINACSVSTSFLGSKDGGATKLKKNHLCGVASGVIFVESSLLNM